MITIEYTMQKLAWKAPLIGAIIGAPLGAGTAYLSDINSAPGIIGGGLAGSVLGMGIGYGVEKAYIAKMKKESMARAFAAAERAQANVLGKHIGPITPPIDLVERRKVMAENLVLITPAVELARAKARASREAFMVELVAKSKLISSK